MRAECEFDTVIRGGRVVDGTRLPSFVGDVAIRDGKVVETGQVTGRGEKEIDAQGLIVAPGVIDVHTHYDAQLNWDPYASQSCWHGVTSVVISLCGFGFAPCRPEDRERAMRRMTRVEAIPYEAMKQGMKWDWETQGEFFDSLQSHGLGVNVAGYIPHSVLRAYVLGEEDSKRADVTETEMEQMKQLMRDGYRAGALGLSTDHNLIDRDHDGSLLPSGIAKEKELIELLSVAKEFNVGSSEVTPHNLHMGEKEQRLLERYAEASGRPVIHSVVIHSNHIPDKWKDTLEKIEDSNSRGHRIYGLGAVHRIGSLFSLLEYNLFDDMPAWNEALACPVEKRIENLSSVEIREKLQHDIDHHLDRVWSGRWDKMKIYQSELSEYQDRYITDIATEEGKSPLEVFCEIAVREKLETYFYIEDQLGDDDSANLGIMQSPYIIPGLSDGGAHAQFISMGKYATVVLSKLVRDDKAISLEEAHWRMSYMSAKAIGIDGLGTLEPGMPADIMIYDLDALKVTTERPYYDHIIGGGKRLIEKSEGYRYMLVNGEITFIDGECTGALPGKILRTSAYEATSNSGVRL